mmetsp:Transcript_3782/g.5489  ORF Transcript_3782/g.5489 Transcript_3782/m.5489 type:complete len:86 (-) Transcript_3782:99-356(-)
MTSSVGREDIDRTTSSSSFDCGGDNSISALEGRTCWISSSRKRKQTKCITSLTTVRAPPPIDANTHPHTFSRKPMTKHPDRKVAK